MGQSTVFSFWNHCIKRSYVVWFIFIWVIQLKLFLFPCVYELGYFNFFSADSCSSRRWNILDDEMKILSKKFSYFFHTRKACSSFSVFDFNIFFWLGRSVVYWRKIESQFLYKILSYLMIEWYRIQEVNWILAQTRSVF